MSLAGSVARRGSGRRARAGTALQGPDPIALFAIVGSLRLQMRDRYIAPRGYSPGVMRWAVVVPAFMIQTPPCLLLSGKPSDCVVAPGTAIVMCVRACSASAPIT